MLLNAKFYVEALSIEIRPKSVPRKRLHFEDGKAHAQTFYTEKISKIGGKPIHNSNFVPWSNIAATLMINAQAQVLNI